MQAAALLQEKLTKGCSEYLEYQHAEMIVSSYQRMAREKVSVLPSDIQGTWAELFRWFTVLLLISAALLITPAMVKERRSGICGLAYTCRAGRGVFRTQFAALLAFLVQGGVFVFCCFAVGPHAADFAFLACDVSCADSLPFWYNLTFGKLLLAYWLMSLLLAAAYAFLSFVISSLCRNHIAAIAAQVPLLMLAVYCLSRFLFLNISSENPSQIQGIFSRVWLCAAFAATALAACMFLVRRRQTCEIFA